MSVLRCAWMVGLAATLAACIGGNTCSSAGSSPLATASLARSLDFSDTTSATDAAGG